MRTLLLLLLRAYQLGISPFLGRNCRFYPSCSEYATEAIREYGPAKGTLLTARRLCKCHPWHPGGVDPVPPKSTGKADAEDANPAAEALIAEDATVTGRKQQRTAEPQSHLNT